MRIACVELLDKIRDEHVTRSVDPVELALVSGGERANQRSHAVRVSGGEAGMLHQRPHAVERVLMWGGRLDHEPLVHGKRGCAVTGLEGGKCLLAAGKARMHENRQRGDPVGHVVGSLKLGGDEIRGLGNRAVSEILQDHIAQGPASGRFGLGREGTGRSHVRVERKQGHGEGVGQGSA